MSKAGDHHYVSQFHLRKWEGADRKITQWGRIAYNGKLVRKLVSTAQTAYVPGLYMLEHVSPHEAEQIETKIFGGIETEAKPVLDKLIADGPGSLSVRDRYWWTVYLNAAILRVPHVVTKVKSDAERFVRAALSADLEEYNAIKGNIPEGTLLEWVERHAPARLANSGMKILVDLLFRERSIDRIIHLTWIVRDVSDASTKLLIGDNPFERIGDLYKPRTLISIPLSPTHVFFASDARDILSKLKAATAKEVVRASNVSTLTTAMKFAYGDAEPQFVDRHFRLPVR